MSGPLGSSQWMYTSGGDFTIPYSCRFDEDRGTVLTRTFGGVGNQKTFTISAWTKPSLLASYQVLLNAYQDDANWTMVGSFDLGESSPTLKVLYQRTGNTSTPIVITNEVFRDPSAWYHIVITIDTTENTAADRVKLWVNGEAITSFGTATLPGLNDDIDWINTDMSHRLMAQHTGYGDGYLAEYHFIDGTAYDADDFGETDEDYGHWKPKKVSGLTYGTNGFYLDFADSGALGDDESGNTNDFTATNFVATDQVLDTPTNNFCTLNPLSRNTSNTPVLSEGNLKQVSGGSSTKGGTIGTMSMQSGKWYFEVYYESHSTWAQFGVIDDAEANTGSIGTSSNPTNGIVYWNNGHVKKNGSTVQSTDATYTAGDIIGIGYDTTNLDISFYKNGVRTNSYLSSAPKGNYTPYVAMEDGTAVVNFGQDSSFAGNKTAQGNQDENGYGDFYYTPPTYPANSDPFITLCTANLPDPAVIPSEHFNTVLFTGNATSNSITGVGFQPDFLWTKCLWPAYSHGIYDVLRGAGNFLIADTDAPAIQNPNTHGMLSFDSDGFSTGLNQYNIICAANNYVSWNWKAGGSGSANTDGDMAETVTVSANADAGFSIVTYTGDGSNATVGHGLSKAPEMVIVKRRTPPGTGTESWATYHSSMATDAETDVIELDTTSSKTDDATRWNDTAPTSSVFSIGTHASVNVDDSTYVAYCFHSVEGYSKLGSYSGTDTSDGAFVYTGFRPAWVMIKAHTTSEPWSIRDSVRSTYNPTDKVLKPDANSSELTSADYKVDLLSNGFKCRHGNSVINASGHSYIYLAFAETPFKYANAR